MRDWSICFLVMRESTGTILSVNFFRMWLKILQKSFLRNSVLWKSCFLIFLRQLLSSMSRLSFSMRLMETFSAERLIALRISSVEISPADISLIFFSQVFIIRRNRLLSSEIMNRDFSCSPPRRKIKIWMKKLFRTR